MLVRHTLAVWLFDTLDGSYVCHNSLNLYYKDKNKAKYTINIVIKTAKNVITDKINVKTNENYKKNDILISHNDIKAVNNNEEKLKNDVRSGNKLISTQCHSSNANEKIRNTLSVEMFYIYRQWNQYIS